MLGNADPISVALLAGRRGGRPGSGHAVTVVVPDQRQGPRQLELPAGLEGGTSRPAPTPPGTSRRPVVKTIVVPMLVNIVVILRQSGARHRHPPCPTFFHVPPHRNRGARGPAPSARGAAGGALPKRLRPGESSRPARRSGTGRSLALRARAACSTPDGHGGGRVEARPFPTSWPPS